LADYGVPLIVLVMSGLSFALQDGTPSGIPRRLSLPNTWDAGARGNWDAAVRLRDLTGGQAASAIVPALIISLLFYFDHNVSAQLAQQKDFRLVRPPAYNWDLLLLAVLVVRRSCRTVTQFLMPCESL
jgi:boron transporter